MTHSTHHHAHENRSVLALASIFAFRMLGLFMILPVFSVFAHHLSGSTPLLIGLALGIYGLTQAILQIPFGMLSDRIGRKPIITMGLVLFALGSIVAAMSHSIYGVIIGRALQGTGAVGSTLIALVADLTREENRTKAMAMVGIIIGTSFSIALVAGPLLNTLIGVNGIFWFTACLAVGGIVMLHTAVPNPPKNIFHSDSEAQPKLFKSVLTNAELLRLDFGIFIQHAILTASFIVIPVTLANVVKIPQQHQWILYLPVLLLSFMAMVPFVIIAEKKFKMKQMFVGAIACLCLAQLLLSHYHQHLWPMAVALFIFFTGFNLLESTLPSLISKIAPAGSKGTAMGVYSSSQFLGIFFGGAIGGWLYGQHHISGVYYACAMMAGVWFLVALTMDKPRHLSTHILPLPSISDSSSDALLNQIKAIAGVEDAAIALDEKVAYLKIDKQVINPDDLLQFSK
jgi:MFS family permease